MPKQITKKYKVWLEIEEIITTNGVETDYLDASPFPVCLGEYLTLEEADAAVEALTGQSSIR